MPKDTFTFKQFTINQNLCAMKVGTDGVALGAIVTPTNTPYILDIGTGTGLIALMLAQKSPSSKIDAIEIDHDAACQARDNITSSPWPHINVIESDFTEFAIKTTQKYDLIVSNPPFFTNSLLSPSKKRAIARHTNTLNFENLCNGVSSIITDEGDFYVILPYECLSEFTSSAMKYGMHLKNKFSLYTKENSPAKRVILTYTKKNVIETYTKEYIVNSSEFKLLTDPYYL